MKDPSHNKIKALGRYRASSTPRALRTGPAYCVRMPPEDAPHMTRLCCSRDVAPEAGALGQDGGLPAVAALRLLREGAGEGAAG